jgi:predicted Rossmann fold flavoprotein
MSSVDVVVIGSGPAGLMGAIEAARDGLRVMLLERMPKVGMKLLATGGGRCNLSNIHPPELFMQAFGRQGRFMQDALRTFGREELCAFFAERGLETAIEAPFIFPKTGGAQDVLTVLLQACEKRGVEIRTQCEVTALLPNEGVVAGDQRIDCKAVLLAGGGKGYGALGGSESGYKLAAALGHTITPLLPADVPLVTVEEWPKALTGIAVEAVNLRIALKGFPKAGYTDNLLFTHKGISGPVAINQSGPIMEALLTHETVPVVLDFTSGRDGLAGWQKRGGNRLAANALSPWFPSALARTFCQLAAIDPEQPASTVSPKQAAQLVETLRAVPLHISGSEGFKKAMVTRGGIKLKEVDPASLESRLVSGLFFAGEILDLDAPCGGFNLQWAFSSGYLAGRSIAQRM